jgi:hypothetical protein
MHSGSADHQSRPLWRDGQKVCVDAVGEKIDLDGFCIIPEGSRRRQQSLIGGVSPHLKPFGDAVELVFHQAGGARDHGHLLAEILVGGVLCLERFPRFAKTGGLLSYPASQEFNAF